MYYIENVWRKAENQKICDCGLIQIYHNEESHKLVQNDLNLKLKIVRSSMILKSTIYIVLYGTVYLVCLSSFWSRL